MKTHDLAKAFRLLARTLQDMPNMPVEDLLYSLRRRRPDTSSIPMALSTLVALSDFDKGQWIDLIHEYDFPIEVRPRDASRDILGKLLSHLEQSPESRRKLRSASNKSRSESSPELARALQFLLKP